MSSQSPAGPLARALNHTTTSYKLLFLKGLLDAAGITSAVEKRDSIPLKEIYVRSIVTAWYPVVTFHLSLGSQDRIEQFIGTIKESPGIDTIEIPSPDRLISEFSGQSSNEDQNRIFKQLDQYVRFRFLTPWIEDELRGLPDSKKNAAIERIAAADAISKPQKQRLPYHFMERDGEIHIALQKQFSEYLRSNSTLVYDWWRWNFARYVQDRNPLCPGIINKIEKPEKRELTLQRIVWNHRINVGDDIRCIYSGAKLDRSFDLDHFIPWSYLLHDKLWNIHPCLPNANRSKSDRLPSLSLYLDRFLILQLEALKSTPLLTDTWSKRQSWKSKYEFQYDISPQLNLLRISRENSKRAQRLLEENIVRLWESAEQQGYATDWIYLPA